MGDLEERYATLEEAVRDPKSKLHVDGLLVSVLAMAAGRRCSVF